MSDQYILPFGAAADELLATIRLLRNCDLGMTPGRSEGVVQLLERLVLLGRDLREMDGVVKVRAQVMAIAAKVDGRATKSERTVRNWRTDAEALGFLLTDFRSQAYGGASWNIFAIDVAAIREVCRAGFVDVKEPVSSVEETPASTQPTGRAETAGNGRKRAEIISAPRPEISAAPGAEIPAAPTHCHTHRIHTTTTSDSAQEPEPDDWSVVVSALWDLGVNAAEKAVKAAQARSLSVSEANELIGHYQEWKPQTANMGPEWLYRWFTGASRPEAPRSKPDQKLAGRGDAMTPEDFAEMNQAIADARSAKDAPYEPMAAMLERLRAQT